MANLSANSGYVWTDNDVYSIALNDNVEGAGSGASFGGIGIDNEPHQVLLNKVQLTHQKQVADESNITALLAFQALFTSHAGTNGWLKAGFQDTALGQIDVILQWGTIVISSSGGNLAASYSLNFGFPLAFPNNCWNVVGSMLGFAPIALTNASVWLFFEAIAKTGARARIGTNYPGTNLIVTSPPAGVTWMAIGY